MSRIILLVYLPEGRLSYKFPALFQGPLQVWPERVIGDLKLKIATKNTHQLLSSIAIVNSDYLRCLLVSVATLPHHHVGNSVVHVSENAEKL